MSGANKHIIPIVAKVEVLSCFTGFAPYLASMQRLILFLLFGLGAQMAYSQTPAADHILNSIERGQQLYQTHCANCHRRSGKGLGKNYPPLAQSDYLLADPDRAIRVVWFGLDGPIEVNGKTYDNAMAAVALSEQELADVMNYILHAWGNSGPLIDSARVKRAIEQGKVEP